MVEQYPPYSIISLWLFVLNFAVAHRWFEFFFIKSREVKRLISISVFLQKKIAGWNWFGFTLYFNDIFSQLSLIYLFVEFSRFWPFFVELGTNLICGRDGGVFPCICQFFLYTHEEVYCFHRDYNYSTHARANILPEILRRGKNYETNIPHEKYIRL